MIELRKLLLNIKHIVVSADPTTTELFTGMLAVSWGLLLILPIDTFGSTKNYTTMEVLAPEMVWAALMFAVGLIQVAAVIYGKVKARKIPAMMSTMLWIFITFMFVSANPASASIAAYAVVSLFSIWTYLRLDVFNHF